MQIKDVIENLEKLRSEASPGTWHISKLDGQWAAAVSSPLMEAIAAGLGTLGGGPEEPLGETTLSNQNDAYALACVNASPLLIAEIQRLERALEKVSSTPKKPKPKKVTKKKVTKKVPPRRKKVPPRRKKRPSL